FQPQRLAGGTHRVTCWVAASRGGHEVHGDGASEAEAVAAALTRLNQLMATSSRPASSMTRLKVLHWGKQPSRPEGGTCNHVRQQPASRGRTGDPPCGTPGSRSGRRGSRRTDPGGAVRFILERCAGAGPCVVDLSAREILLLGPRQRSRPRRAK